MKTASSHEGSSTMTQTPPTRPQHQHWGIEFNMRFGKGQISKQYQVDMLIADKMDFKTKTIKWQRRSLYNNKGFNLPSRYNNWKYICTQHWITQIHKANIIRDKERDRPQYDNKELQYPNFSIRQIIQTENQQRNIDIYLSIDQVDLIDIYRILHPMAVEYTFFSLEHESFSRIDHTFSHKTYL